MEPAGNIVIKSQKLRLMINSDPNNFIEFDPSDVDFVEGFYNLIKQLELKEIEYESLSQKLGMDKTFGPGELPANVPERIQLVKDICRFMHEQIDVVFGQGTSAKVFGNSLNLEAFEQFFEGIGHYVKSSRFNKVSRYRKRPTAAAVRTKTKKK